MMRFIYLAFGGALVVEMFAQDVTCGVMTVALGLAAAVTLVKQYEVSKRNEEAWTNNVPYDRPVNWEAPMVVIVPNPASTAVADGNAVRMQVHDTVPGYLKDPAMRDEWHKQDVLQAVATYYAQVGGVTDTYIDESIDEILGMPQEMRHDAFDTLYTQIVNGHPHGVACDKLQDVYDAWDQA